MKKFVDKTMNFLSWLLDIDGLILAGEGVRDIVVCIIVIQFLINNFLFTYIPIKGWAGWTIPLVIVLVPVFYSIKWLDRIFGVERNKKETQENVK